MKIELGNLESVEPRSVWENEAYNFTPWIAENIGQIGNEIGMDLEIRGTEVPAGPYSADILAEDIGTNQIVVIENQLEKTNHDHLGKAITYASELNAQIVVWLAPTFTDEHRKALDWLNTHVKDEVAFYGIRFQLWKIEDSLPALSLDVVSRPTHIAIIPDRGMNDREKVRLVGFFQITSRMRKRRRIMVNI